MFNTKQIRRATAVLLPGAFISAVFLSTAGAQSDNPPAKPAARAAPVRYLPNPPRRAQMFYEGAWGVDSLNVRWAESGEIVRFSWRVTDPERAKPLNDKKSEPYLIDWRAGVRLVVPSLEKVGKLRQSSTPEAGKQYWMAFSNAGRRVKQGDRVDVVIGNFHAAGLVVE